MSTLIIFDSLFGNTALAARTLAAILPGEITLKKIDDVHAEDLYNNQRLALLTPTHGGRASVKIQNFIKSIPVPAWQGKLVTVLSTGIPASGQNLFLRLVIKVLGYAAAPTLASLVKKGAKMMAPPLNLMVAGRQGPLLAGELEKIKAWSGQFKTQV